MKTAMQTGRQSGTPPISGMLQRKCSGCGNHTTAGAKCEECGKKTGGLLQRKVSRQSDFSEVPPVVHDVLRSPGQPLDAGTRGFMETRFGHDFSQVHVHTDGRAAESAASVDAAAYTLGSHVVFGNSQYQPETEAGKKLLAHELAHVVQQAGHNSSTQGVSSPSDPSEIAADAVAETVMHGESPGTLPIAPVSSTAAGLMRTASARLTRCTANTDGAPADPLAELQTNDARARDIAQQLSTAFAQDARDARGGLPAAPSATFQSYEDHFGLPGAEGSGFLNRLTGEVRPTFEVAMSEELQILSRRYALIARLFSQSMNYFCVAGEGVQFGGCESGPCDQGDAWSCRGVGVVFFCPSFWTGFDSEGRAGILVHEATHIILGPTNPREVGQIGDQTLQGPGRNFNIAGCYEAITNDVFGIDSGFSCPGPP